MNQVANDGNAKAIVFTLEVDGDDIYVFAEGIPGYFLWASDKERALRSVIPLAQHLFWANGNDVRVPSSNPDVTELLSGPIKVFFAPATQLVAPELGLDGFWMESPSGYKFFIPQENGATPARVAEKITADLDSGRLL